LRSIDIVLAVSGLFRVEELREIIRRRLDEYEPPLEFERYTLGNLLAEVADRVVDAIRRYAERLGLHPACMTFYSTREQKLSVFCTMGEGVRIVIADVRVDALGEVAGREVYVKRAMKPRLEKLIVD
jgi:hypothetical protein